MSTESQPRILLFGAGAVGTVYLWLLSKVASTTAVCRSNYDVAKAHGFTINSTVFGQNIRFKPHVVRSCDEAAAIATTPAAPFDYIVVSSKAIPGTASAAISRAVTPSHTAIVLLQNGVGIEEEFAQAFPGNPIISACLYFPATQRPAGIIAHGDIERLEVGGYPSSSAAAGTAHAHARAFTELVEAAGATAVLYADIQQRRWTKLLINASWNPICALTLSRDTQVLEATGEAADAVRGVMLEIRDIAAACGYVITREEVDFHLGGAQARVLINAGIEPSMLQDIQAGRRTEVEAIIGNPMRLGKEKGVRCERLEMLYVLTKALDLHVRSSE